MGRFIAIGELCVACVLVVGSFNKRWRSSANSMSRVALQARALAHRLIGTPERAQLFDDGSEQLTAPVRLKGIRIERPRQFWRCVSGACVVARKPGLRLCASGCFRSARSASRGRRMAAVLVAARFLRTVERVAHRGGLVIDARRFSDLLQLGDEEVNKDRLYRGLDHLLAYKTELEAHLSQRCGELFAIQNEVLLYDVTSHVF